MATDKIKRLRGFKDITPEESYKWQHAESVIADVFKRYNYKEIRVPILELGALFQRSIGEVTDIVQKEMYIFEDRHGDRVAMRPEGTAPVVRAYIENNLCYPPAVKKLCYFGPMFRYERPQAGRLRQFHQAGAEVFGSNEPYIDAEVISMLYRILIELKVSQLAVKINSVGCAECRPNYLEYLKDFFAKNSEGFCELCIQRMKVNPLRVLDCKNSDCKKLLTDVEGTYQHLCTDCDTHFQEVTSTLDTFDIPYTVDKFLVRGLDYYTKTAFEITSSALGSQDAVAGGGRYDKLVEELGGPKTESVGFAIGMERLIMLLPDDLQPTRPDVYVAAVGEGTKQSAIKLLDSLRKEGFIAEANFKDSFKSALKKASKGRYRFCCIIGEEEAQNGTVMLKDLDKGEQQNLPNDISQIKPHL